MIIFSTSYHTEATRSKPSPIIGIANPFPCVFTSFNNNIPSNIEKTILIDRNAIT